MEGIMTDMAPRDSFMTLGLRLAVVWLVHVLCSWTYGPLDLRARETL